MLSLLATNYKNIICASIIGALCIYAGYSKITSDRVKDKLEVCNARMSAHQEIILSQKAEYEDNIKNYEEAIIKAAQSYENDLKNINEFKEDNNANKCENALKLLNTYRY